MRLIRNALVLFSLILGTVAAAVPDCSYQYTFSNVTGFSVDNKITYGSTSTTVPINNQYLGCQSWSFSYSSSGFSVVSISLQSAPATTLPLVPGIFATFAGTTTSGINPGTSITSATYLGVGVLPWLRINSGTATGTGTIIVNLFGWKDPNFGGGSGSSFVPNDVRSSQSVGQVIPGGFSNTTLLFDTNVSITTPSMHSTVTSTGNFVVPVTGWYTGVLNVLTDNASVNNIGLNVWLNGVSIAGSQKVTGTSNGFAMNIPFQAQMTAGDIVTAVANSDSGFTTSSANGFGLTNMSLSRAH